MKIREAFADGGPIAGLMTGYLPRAGQLKLAVAADEAVGRGQILLAEAPAGVGKSFGYGVPIALSVGEQKMVVDGKLVPRHVRALIVTSNIALQEQLAERDLPMLADAFGDRFSHALLKGRNNYLCLSKLDQLEEAELRMLGGDLSTIDALKRWVIEETGPGGTGDKARLPRELADERLWSRVSCGEGECKGAACKRAPACFSRAAKERAFGADIVVCNYHLLFGAMKVAEGGEGGVSEHVLPPFDLLVLDEAHRAADTARSFFGFQVTSIAFDRAVSLLAKLGEKTLADAVKTEGRRLMDELGRYAASDQYRIRLRKKGEVKGARARVALDDAARAYGRLAASEGDVELKAELRLAATRCKRIVGRLSAAEDLSDPGAVYYIETERSRPALCSKQVDVSKRLRADLWDHVSSALVVSATLQVGGKLDYAVAELGVPATRLRKLVVGSPFDFERQAMLVVPDDMPFPTDRAFPAAVGEQLRRTIEVAGGRTLALFTSRAVMGAAQRALVGCRYPVLVQGDEPRTRLLERFRSEIDSVLLGLASFWEGVDVPGEALSCLVIDRLPFPRPDDPVLDAMNDRLGKQCFFQYSIPRAVTTFCQGFGRLIRSVEDRGVVVVLDRRILDKPYGATFLRSLPGGVRISRKVEDAAGLLESRTQPDAGQLRLAIDAMDAIDV